MQKIRSLGDLIKTLLIMSFPHSEFIFIVLVFFVSSCDSGRNDYHNIQNSKITYITESNSRIEDLKYLIGIKLKAIGNDEKIENDFKIKSNDIQKKYSNQLRQLVMSEGFSEDHEFASIISMDNTLPATDTAWGPDGPPNVEYQKRKNNLKTKIFEIRKIEESETNSLRKEILLNVIKKDKLLEELLDDYRSISKSRQELILKMGLNKEDSINLFSKKFRGNIDEEVLNIIL